MSRWSNPFMQHLTIDFAAPFKESKNARLLVVEDDPFIRELYAIVLRMNGYWKAATRFPQFERGDTSKWQSKLPTAGYKRIPSHCGTCR